jgi:acylphosphatase
MRMRLPPTRIDLSDIVRAFRVSGRVQGVYFRQSTRMQAERLRLRGFACNLPDGCVEVVVQGAEPDVTTLAEWLQHGPPQARVAAVDSIPVPAGIELPEDFQTR